MELSEMERESDSEDERQLILGRGPRAPAAAADAMRIMREERDRDAELSRNGGESAIVDTSQFFNTTVGRGYQHHTVQRQPEAKHEKMVVKGMSLGGASAPRKRRRDGGKKSGQEGEGTVEDKDKKHKKQRDSRGEGSKKDRKRDRKSSSKKKKDKSKKKKDDDRDRDRGRDKKRKKRKHGGGGSEASDESWKRRVLRVQPALEQLRRLLSVRVA